MVRGYAARHASCMKLTKPFRIPSTNLVPSRSQKRRSRLHQVGKSPLDLDGGGRYDAEEFVGRSMDDGFRRGGGGGLDATLRVVAHGTRSDDGDDGAELRRL